MAQGDARRTKDHVGDGRERPCLRYRSEQLNDDGPLETMADLEQHFERKNQCNNGNASRGENLSLNTDRTLINLPLGISARFR